MPSYFGERCLCGSAYPGARRQGFVHTTGSCYRDPREVGMDRPWHWHVCPSCSRRHTDGGCDGRGLLSDCANGDYCENHSSLNTKEAQ